MNIQMMQKLNISIYIQSIIIIVLLYFYFSVGKKPDKTDRRVRLEESDLKEILLDMFEEKNELTFEEIE